MDPTEVWRSAQLMIRMHGADAPARCADKAAEFQKKSDEVGQLIWLAVARAALSVLTEGVPTDFDELQDPFDASGLRLRGSSEPKVELRLTGAEIGCLLVLVKSKQDDVRVKSQRRFLSTGERTALNTLSYLLEAARLEMEAALGRAAAAPAMDPI